MASGKWWQVKQRRTSVNWSTSCAFSRMWSKPSPSNSLHNGSRQSQHPQEPGGTALAAPASSCPLPLHPDTCLLGQLGGMFFSIPGKQGLSQSVHTSKRQLKEFLLDYIACNNENPSPFVWNKGPERLQHIIEASKEYQATHAQAAEAPPDSQYYRETTH
jgi:hypothetical protein